LCWGLEDGLVVNVAYDVDRIQGGIGPESPQSGQIRSAIPHWWRGSCQVWFAVSRPGDSRRAQLEPLSTHWDGQQAQGHCNQHPVHTNSPRFDVRPEYSYLRATGNAMWRAWP